MDHDFCQEIDLIFPNICPWFLVFCFFFLFWSFKLSNIFVGFLSVLTLGMWCRIQHLHSSLQIETPGCHSDFVTNCDNICIFLLKAKLPPELFSELYHPHCYQGPTSGSHSHGPRELPSPKLTSETYGIFKGYTALRTGKPQTGIVSFSKLKFSALNIKKKFWC